MRLVEVALGSLIAVGCLGCPGTIEDPSGFEELARASRHDGGAELGDAAVDAVVPTLDAAQDAAVEDAETVPEAAPNEEDASAGWDGSLQLDAGDAPITSEAGTDGGPGCDFQALIMSKCAGCHSVPLVSNQLDLTAPDLAQRLAGRQATDDCSSYLLIDPVNPNRSALYLKVTRDACGARMPLQRPLNDVEQACVLRWIESLN
jgi:hypothetical protein